MDDVTTIELHHLTKDYGGGRGIFDVSFDVRRGETFGFLGPNGAGKTVTMRHLMGFVRPDGGTAFIKGLDCFRDRARIQTNLGYLPGETTSIDEMTGTGFLRFMARLKRVSDLRRCSELIEYFDLDPSRKIRKMSKGTKQKVGLVCAFMSSPDTLLLDEPTSGLDPLMQNRFVDLVLAEKKRGTTILLSSHLFEEVERTCDRVAFVRSGKLAAVERMDDVRSARKRIFSIVFAQTDDRDRYTHDHPGAQVRGTRTVQTIAENGVDAFVKDLARYDIVDMAVHEQTLEETFLHLYGHVPEGDDHE